MTERIREFLAQPTRRRALPRRRSRRRARQLSEVRPRPARHARVLRREGQPGAARCCAASRALGSCFDAASVAEIEMVLAAGATADRISFGNTIKKERDIARALELGVRLFAVDCEAEVEKIARAAETADVGARGQGVLPHPLRLRRRRVAAVAEIRLRARDGGRRAGARLSARAGGLWRVVPRRVAAARHRVVGRGAGPSRRAVFRACAERGIHLSMVNLGGGFPTKYLKDVPAVEAYGDAIFRALSQALRQPHPGDDHRAGPRHGRQRRRHRGRGRARLEEEPRRGRGALGLSRHRQVRRPRRDDGRVDPLPDPHAARRGRARRPACSPARPATRPTCSTRRSPTCSRSRWRSATRC